MKRKLLIIISLLIGIFTNFYLKMNTNNNKFNLESIYYKQDKFMSIDSSELDSLLNNKKVLYYIHIIIIVHLKYHVMKSLQTV